MDKIFDVNFVFSIEVTFFNYFHNIYIFFFCIKIIIDMAIITNMSFNFAYCLKNIFILLKFTILRLRVRKSPLQLKSIKFWMAVRDLELGVYIQLPTQLEL